MNRNDALDQVLESVGKRNPGALDVCCRLIDHLQELAAFDFEACLRENITGEDLYILFAYCCKRDIAMVHSALMQGTAQQKVAEWWKQEKAKYAAVLNEEEQDD